VAKSSLPSSYRYATYAASYRDFNLRCSSPLEVFLVKLVLHPAGVRYRSTGYS
jgi:hypothetical protein